MVTAKPYVDDGDVGCGAPDTPQWHLCVIAQLSDAEIIEHMKAAFDVEIKDVRQQAEDIINGNST